MVLVLSILSSYIAYLNAKCCMDTSPEEPEAVVGAAVVSDAVLLVESSARARSVREGARGSPLPRPLPSLLTRPRGSSSRFPRPTTLPAAESKKETVCVLGHMSFITYS